jgi:hypothetical protein
MKKLICILVTCLSTLITFSQSTNQIAIIPEPVSLQKTQGQFIAPARISIYTENPEALKQPIEVLRKHFSTAAGLPVSVSTTQKTSTITL